MRDKTSAHRIWRIPEILLWCLLAVFFINVFGIFSFTMPASSLDQCWIYALNQAIAQGIYFGRDVIFTFGPYASVYTHSYHPGTVWITIIGTILIDSLFVSCFTWLVKGARWRWPLIVVCILTMPVLTQDAFLLSVPLLVGLVLVKLQIVGGKEQFNKTSTRVLIGLAFACLGLLPLIKGTLLLSTAGICFLCAAFLFSNRLRLPALVCLLTPVVAMIVFWAALGQPLRALPVFVSNLKYIISGYSEAMVREGPHWQFIPFALGVAVVLLTVALKKELSTSQRGFLLLSYTFFLFLGFKAGFVRHDIFHFPEAMNCVTLACLFLPLLNTDAGLSFNGWRLPVVALIATLLTYTAPWQKAMAVEARIVDPSLVQYDGQPPFQTLRHFKDDVGILRWLKAIAVTQPFRFLPWDFKFTSWPQEFERAKVAINDASKLDFIMPGTTDVYSYEQSGLIAKGYNWAPRPVLQSYSAYTPELIRLDEQHLRHAQAPDNLLFRLETVDNRFPSLDDGMSWPAMLDNYSVAGAAHDWVHLVKKQRSSTAASRYIFLAKTDAALGAEVPLPSASGPIFAEIIEKPSAVGKLASLVYKQPILRLKVSLRNGKQSTYRVHSNMMQTGFFISPLITSNADFVRLFDSKAPSNDDQLVQSIALFVAGPRTARWSSTYTVTFKQYQY